MVELLLSDIIHNNDLIASEPSNHYGFVRSPLNYIGGKYKLLPQLLPLFPRQVNTFIDLFCGGCNVGINAHAKKIVFNDNLSYLIDFYKALGAHENNEIIAHIENRIKEFSLSLSNEEGYKQLRRLYNTKRNPLDLFVLVAYSFNHQIRFNNSHEFNNPFGRERSSFNPAMRSNLYAFLNRLKNRDISFYCSNFCHYDFSTITENDFVYCDPPYLITTGSYNDGKRGFTGWSSEQEKLLLNLLSALNDRNIKFGLSNVLRHKGKQNDILMQWAMSNDFYVIHLNSSYSNSNYHTHDRTRNATDEVFISNYQPVQQQLNLEF